MHRLSVGRTMAAMGLMVVGAGTAAAEPARTMSALQERLARGKEVTVVDRDGQVTQGLFVSAGREGVLVDLYGNALRRVPAADVVGVDRRGDSSANGTLIGAAAGTAIGVAFALTPPEERYACDSYSGCYAWCPTDSCRRTSGVIVAVLGAAVGFAIDRHDKGTTAVYRPPAPRLALSVKPQVVRRGLGVRVALGF